MFTSLRDYVGAVGGAESVERVFRDEIYLTSGAYDDEHFSALVSRACEETGAEADEFLHDFGVFTAERTFARLYPAFFTIADSARDFLLTVETRIHELVRATVPNARPPRLNVSELGEHGVSIVYSSPRQLCVLLRGLAHGVALYYQEPFTIEESTCMRRGDEACTFEVSFRGERRSA
jgi:hypothetical protein